MVLSLTNRFFMIVLLSTHLPRASVPPVLRLCFRMSAAAAAASFVSRRGCPQHCCSRRLGRRFARATRRQFLHEVWYTPLLVLPFTAFFMFVIDVPFLLLLLLLVLNSRRRRPTEAALALRSRKQQRPGSLRETPVGKRSVPL